MTWPNTHKGYLCFLNVDVRQILYGSFAVEESLKFETAISYELLSKYWLHYIPVEREIYDQNQP